jgi:hypothetical protein
MELINPYTPDVELRNFPFLEQQLINHYDFYVREESGGFHSNLKRVGSQINNFTLTPRALFEYKVGFKPIFYYISWLYDNNPKNVIDIGAGEAIFKKWFPNLISLDPWVVTKAYNNTHDYICMFDAEFAKNHVEEFDCGMALNSLHFGGLITVIKNIHLAMSIIKPGGRFLFTLNLGVIYPAFKRSVNALPIIEDFYNELLKYSYKIILLDVPAVRNSFAYSEVNGDIRFILEK